ncbi:MAG: phosphoglycerate kinase [Patescibacteria group bacterium]
MKLKTLRNNMNLKGKRVLVRVDTNVSLIKGKIIEGSHGKVARAAVDLEWLAQRGAKVIIATHLGRPCGKVIPAYSVKPIAKRLSSLLGTKVPVARGVVGPKVQSAVSRMNNGDFLLLENVRFDPRETKNSTAFAQELASLADMYVNDAFGDSHRAHTSIDVITSEFPSYAGPLLLNEVQVLEKISKQPKPPFYLFIGGAKINTKMSLMEHLLPMVDKVFIGGAIANTFFHAKDKNQYLGKSVVDESETKLASQILKKWSEKIILPIDVVVARSCRKDSRSRTVRSDEIEKGEMIVDVGSASLKMYSKELLGAKTILWNGPFGYYECGPFGKGSEELARIIASRTGKAVTVVGGGDTVAVVENAGVANRFSLLSSGGGAMLAFLAGEQMPGLEALRL